MWQCYAPRTLLQSTGLCTMGCALPLAMGYKLVAQPERTVVAFTGDAGLEMVLGELATLRDLGAVAFIVVVFVDECLTLIELKQRDVGYANVRRRLRCLGLSGRGAGLRHARRLEPTIAIALENELRQAMERNKSTLIACPIGSRPYEGRF